MKWGVTEEQLQGGGSPAQWVDITSEEYEDHKNDKDEFLNELMWAHYADSHKGICIQYNLPDYMSKLRNENGSIVSYFNDVKYSDEDLGSYSNKDAISSEDAFFLKGKKWEYENELRFLRFDLNGKGEHETIKIPNCIEAIYFGLECSEKDKETIINIMESKNLKKSVEFYQMEFDDQHFGQLKAVKIETEPKFHRRAARAHFTPFIWIEVQNLHIKIKR